VETLVPALPEAPSVSPGTEHILLIDDEPNLIRLLQSRLSLLGYRVTAFTESLEALKEFLTHPDAFDLILSDQTMPGFSGAELAKQVKKTRPSIPIIIMTGFSEILTPEKVQELGLHALMSKPLDFLELSRHIRSAFDAPRSP
jgi:CheY-like chemotaxis protein